MVCDDEKSITSSVKNLIRKICINNNLVIEIEIVMNGIECLYKIYRDYYMGIKYDILLIDESMPFIRGSMITSILKNIISSKELNKILIYSITGYDDEMALNQIKSFGCDGFLKKPIRHNTLTAIIEKFLSDAQN